MYDAALCVASVENVKKYMSYFMAGDLQVTYNDPGAGEAFTSLNGTYAYVAVRVRMRKATMSGELEREDRPCDARQHFLYR